MTPCWLNWPLKAAGSPGYTSERLVIRLLFAFLFDPANRGMIRAEWVAAYYDLDRARAIREAPYFVAAPLLSGPIGSVDDLGRHDEPCILAYDLDRPLLLAQPVITLLPPTHTDEQQRSVCYEYGRDSFLPLLGAAYTLLNGSVERLSIGTLWWKVGIRREDTLHLAASAKEIFYLPGSWGISFNDAEPERWQPVTTTCVFVFNEPSSWDVDQVDFLVGTSGRLAFYQDAAWAGFDSENDDYDYHEIQESYTESCAAHIRALEAMRSRSVSRSPTSRTRCRTSARLSSVCAITIRHARKVLRPQSRSPPATVLVSASASNWFPSP